MIALASGIRVYLACGTTDMRKGMTGLAMLVQQGLAADCQTASNIDPRLECAPWGGQNQATVLTVCRAC